nr:unnamed protein product [Digitaria exilis]
MRQEVKNFIRTPSIADSMLAATIDEQQWLNFASRALPVFPLLPCLIPQGSAAFEDHWGAPALGRMAAAAHDEAKGTWSLAEAKALNPAPPENLGRERKGEGGGRPRRVASTSWRAAKAWHEATVSARKRARVGGELEEEPAVATAPRPDPVHPRLPSCDCGRLEGVVAAPRWCVWCRASAPPPAGSMEAQAADREAARKRENRRHGKRGFGNLIKEQGAEKGLIPGDDEGAKQLGE